MTLCDMGGSPVNPSVDVGKMRVFPLNRFWFLCQAEAIAEGEGSVNTGNGDKDKGCRTGCNAHVCKCGEAVFFSLLSLGQNIWHS